MTKFDVAVIGGGPAGASLGRLLALRGRSVLLLTRPIDPARGLAESLPPSSRKVLAAVGMLEAVDAAGFLPTTGNTVWWGDRSGDIEEFSADDEVYGYQVFRPAFDQLLIERAAAAGVTVCQGAVVTRVRLGAGGEAGQAHVEYEHDGTRQVVTAAFAIDCSGRAGVIARQGSRRYDPRFRMQAFIGAWRRESAWPLQNESHTVVETYEDGWAWSVPVAPGLRHIVTMVDGGTTTISRGPTLRDTYLSELRKTRELSALSAAGRFESVFACDASLYTSTVFAGRNFVLVGDAASTIDPLSSFGVKKALASAWLAAVAVDTALAHPDRQGLALELFSRRERQMYASYFRRSSDYAKEAAGRHDSSFWSARAAAELTGDQRCAAPGEITDRRRLQTAFERLKASPAMDLRVSDRIALVPCGVVRANEIVVEDSYLLEEAGEPLRFVADVDVVVLARMAPEFRRVIDLYDAYAGRQGPVPLPNLLTALSALLAHGVLVDRD